MTLLQAAPCLFSVYEITVGAGIGLRTRW